MKIKKCSTRKEFQQDNIGLINNIITASINNDTNFFKDLTQEIINLSIEEEYNISKFDKRDISLFDDYLWKSNFVNSLITVSKISLAIDPIGSSIPDEYTINNILPLVNSLTTDQKQLIIKSCNSIFLQTVDIMCPPIS